MLANVLPHNNFTVFTMPAGSVIEMVLISFALAYRIKKLNTDKQLAFEQLLTAEKDKSELHYKNLQLSMNPHFLANALNSIRLVSYEVGVEKSSEYLAKYSHLMQLMLEQGKSELISLEKEITFLKNYVELETLRFSNKVDFKVSLSKGINSVHTKIPPMILQPLIENALLHGLYHKPENGILNLSIELENKSLKILIDDNGVGMERSQVLNKHRKKDSNALKILQDRLQKLGEVYEIELKIRHEALYPNEKDTGTRVSLYLPVIIDTK